MVVAIQQPQQKESDLDQIAKALSIASTVFGIKSKFDEQAFREKQLEAIGAREQRAEAREQRAEARDVAREEARIAGQFAPVPEGTRGAIALPGREGLFLPRQDIRAREQNAISLENQRTKLALQQIKDEKTRDKAIKESARKLGENISKKGLAEPIATLNQIDKAIGGIDGTEDIPGVGGVSNLAGAPLLGQAAETFLSDEGKRVRQLVGGLRNQILKARSGGAVTPQEAERMLEELGLGVLRSDEQLRAGLKNVRESLRAALSTIEATADPEVLAEFRSRKGALSTDDPIFQPGGIIQAPPGEAVAEPPPSRDEILQELQRRGLRP